MHTVHDVAIIGAGIAGTAMAKSLADKGWNTVLFERKAFPRHKVCGEFLSPESRSMLNALGVSELIETLQPNFMDRTRLVFSHGDSLVLPLPGTALGISRYALDTVLLSAARAAGAEVHTETTVKNITAQGKGYLIETQGKHSAASFEVRTVIAAWGTNGHIGLNGSSTNRPVQSNRKSKQHTYIGIKSHFTGIPMEPAVELYFLNGGYVGISSVEDGRVNVAALLKQHAFQTKPKSIMGWIEAACSRNDKLKDKLAKGVPVEGTQAAVAPVDLSRKPLAWDRFPQAGDAALMIPPLCGDGMSMALRSAELNAKLADRFLKNEISLSDWKVEYSRSINQQFKGPLQWGRTVQWIISKPHLARLLPFAARMTPKLAYELVQATRLKERES